MLRGRGRALCSSVLLAILLVACGAVGTLKKFKERSSAADYAWIAQQDITCTAKDDGCNQLHLIKGDACLRLAEQGNEPRAHYECAATELQTGIDQTKEWQLGELNLNRAQTYENLCESLRHWQDLERGAGADQLTKRLADTAQRFLDAEPNNLAAIYFLNRARFTLLDSELLHPHDPQGLCRKLNAILQDVTAAEPRARGTRYAPNYTLMVSELKAAKRTVPGCA